MGFEYELSKTLRRTFGDRTRNSIGARHRQYDCTSQSRGSYDLVAANLTVTRERKELVELLPRPCSTPGKSWFKLLPEKAYKLTYDQLEERLVRNLIELANDTVHVLEGTAFRSRLENLSDEIGEEIVLLDPGPEYNTELLVRMVSEGKIKYTVADENQAKINKKYFPNIDIRTPISFPQQIAWATSKNDLSGFLESPQRLDCGFQKIKGLRQFKSQVLSSSHGTFSKGFERLLFAKKPRFSLR